MTTPPTAPVTPIVPATASSPDAVSRAARRPNLIALALAAVLVLPGCAVPGGPVVVTETVATVTGAPAQGGVGGLAEAPGPVPSGPPSAPAPADPAPAAPAPAGATALDLAAVTAAAPGPAGVAVTPVGRPAEVVTSGTWQSGVAWSTIKVPLAVAVARWSPQALEGATSAITVSDNQAAETLWATLGGGDAAAAEVGAVLADAGDTTTRVPSVHTRAGYSIFGQTQWSLADQARFAAALPCLGGAARVVDLMGRIAPEQRWGLGRIPGARFKGGWGPGVQGGYLVRQFGLVPGAGGDLAVVIAVEAPTFEAGTAALSAMADALAPQLATATGGAC